MGKLLLFFTFLGSLDPTYEEAADKTRVALFETKLVQMEMEQLKLDAHDKVFKWTGLGKDELAYAGYAYPIFAGRVSTKPFKNFKYTDDNGFTYRPEMEYIFKDGEYTVKIVLLKEF